MQEDFGKPTIDRIWDMLLRHERELCGNGQPGLEKRVIAYIDSKAGHVKRNYEEDLQHSEFRQDERHKDNQRKFDSIIEMQATANKYIYVGIGILMALNALGLATHWTWK